MLWAETVGNDLEGKAFVQVADNLEIPVYVSVVLDEKGNVLNGMPIDEFIGKVDGASDTKPVRYLSNCSWQAQVELMYERAANQGVLDRLGGFYNNASNIRHEDKQDLTAVQRYKTVDDYIGWVGNMLEKFPHLREDEDIWISGCCGFCADDIDQLIKAIA